MKHGDKVKIYTIVKGKKRIISTTIDATENLSFPQYGYILVAGWQGFEGPVSIPIESVIKD